jgi:hypothetical protein
MNYLKYYKFLIVGFGVLFVAIILNVLAKIIGLITWYDFINNFKIDFFSILFLFIIYPFVLGLSSYYLVKWINLK